MPGGRPTKYNAEMLKLANAYIEQFEENGDAVPIVAGLANYLQVTKSTVYKWGEDHPEFSDTLDELQQKQEQMLASGALRNDFNATIAKLMLHNHGYSDKAEVEQKGEIKVIGLNKDFGDA